MGFLKSFCFLFWNWMGFLWFLPVSVILSKEIFPPSFLEEVMGSTHYILQAYMYHWASPVFISCKEKRRERERDQRPKKKKKSLNRNDLRKKQTATNIKLSYNNVQSRNVQGTIKLSLQRKLFGIPRCWFSHHQSKSILIKSFKYLSIRLIYFLLFIGPLFLTKTQYHLTVIIRFSIYGLNPTHNPLEFLSPHPVVETTHCKFSLN